MQPEFSVVRVESVEEPCALKHLQNAPLGERGKCDRLVLRLCVPTSGLDELDETQIRFGMLWNIDDN